jgi:hypothetical protein
MEIPKDYTFLQCNMTAILLGSCIKSCTDDGGRTWYITTPREDEIVAAIVTAKRIIDRVVK